MKFWEAMKALEEGKCVKPKDVGGFWFLKKIGNYIKDCDGEESDLSVHYKSDWIILGHIEEEQQEIE